MIFSTSLILNHSVKIFQTEAFLSAERHDFYIDFTFASSENLNKDFSDFFILMRLNPSMHDWQLSRYRRNLFTVGDFGSLRMLHTI